jgi:hypothetical protein
MDTSRERGRSSNTWSGHWQPLRKLVVMNTGHDPMVSTPVELTDIF